MRHREGNEVSWLTSWLAWIWRRYCMRRSGGPEPCAACSSTSACGERGSAGGAALGTKSPGAGAPPNPATVLPCRWDNPWGRWHDPTGATRGLVAPTPRLGKGAGSKRVPILSPAWHRAHLPEKTSPGPQLGPQGLTPGHWLCLGTPGCVWGELGGTGGAALPRSLGYLDAPDDGVVHPAHVGQRRALHEDLHRLDGARWAQVIHGHLGEKQILAGHSSARGGGGSGTPQAIGLGLQQRAGPQAAAAIPPVPALCTPLICSPDLHKQTQQQPGMLPALLRASDTLLGPSEGCSPRSGACWAPAEPLGAPGALLGPALDMGMRVTQRLCPDGMRAATPAGLIQEA